MACNKKQIARAYIYLADDIDKLSMTVSSIITQAHGLLDKIAQVEQRMEDLEKTIK